MATQRENAASRGASWDGCSGEVIDSRWWSQSSGLSVDRAMNWNAVGVSFFVVAEARVTDSRNGEQSNVW